MKSICCLRGTHKKCEKLGAWGYFSVVTGQPVESKGKCECVCHGAKEGNDGKDNTVVS